MKQIWTKSLFWIFAFCLPFAPMEVSAQKNFQPRVAATNSFASPGGGGFTPNAADFDGSNDYLNLGGALTTDGKVGLISVWFKTPSSGAPVLSGSANQVFTVTVGATLTISGYADSMLSDEVLKLQVNTDYRDNAWHHLMSSWDHGGVAKHHVYIDGVDVTNPIIHDDTAILYSATDWTIGSRGDSFGKWEGCLSEYYFAKEYLDLSMAGNRDNFYNAGDPVDLGATGTGGTGNQPLVYIRAWSGANAGSGGAFTVNGSLGVCGTTP